MMKPLLGTVPAMLIFGLLVANLPLATLLIAVLCGAAVVAVVRRESTVYGWLLPVMGMALVGLGAALLALGGEAIRMVALNGTLLGHVFVIVPALGLLLLVAPLWIGSRLTANAHPTAGLVVLPLILYTAYVLSGFGFMMMPNAPPDVWRAVFGAALAVIGLGVVPIVVMMVEGIRITPLAGVTLEVAALVLSAAVLANGISGTQVLQIGVIHGAALLLLLPLVGVTRRGREPA